jgi:BirA family biotin operon repressor/biotin-[acetyl-CoA-carboxylase] ligase
VGVAVARALESCGVAGVALKWPNDVLSGDAKLGGVLLEMSGDTSGNCRVVIGVGLNVDMPDAAAAGIEQTWTDVNTIALADKPTRNQLLAAMLNELLPMAADFESCGFAAWRDAWQVLDAHRGRPVTLHTGTSQMTGIARGVDERGALQLETSTGVHSIYGGEMSLRASQS